jgi:hypothetical protein
VSCPAEATPAGWKVWRGPVPSALVQIAVDARDHINQYPYGQFVSQVDYQGQPVGIYKSHHSWTYRNGVLINGICIPGISLMVPATAVSGSPGVAAAPAADALLTPDPNAALFGADDLERTDWQLVASTVAAAAIVVAAFWFGLQHAGRARRSN